jgi:hypothetical protein
LIARIAETLASLLPNIKKRGLEIVKRIKAVEETNTCSPSVNSRILLPQLVIGCILLALRLAGIGNKLRMQSN